MKHTTKYILDKLTDEQKASLLCGAGFFSTREIKEAAIRRLQFLDGGTGMNFEQLFGDIFIAYAIENGYTREQFDHVIHNFYKLDNLTAEEKKLRDELFEKLTRYTGGFEPHPGCYPPGILLGSTWNPEVVYENGQALGLEARMYKVSCLLGTPNVNLLREPRNGRFFEGYSEDPLVGGLLGREMVKGVESQQVASDVKHFAANNLEINRSGIDQRISRRALEEMYLPAFEKCVKAGAATVMAAYPKINGEHCTENPWLLREVLKERWGFEGLCMTDWGACVGDSGDSVASGIDLLMPGPWNKEEEILAALADGRLSREDFEDACMRFIELGIKYNKNDTTFPVPYDEYIEKGRKACYDACAEGIIMLKNENALFPLDDMNRVTLYGSDELRIYGSGSAQVITDRAPSLKDVFGQNKDGDVAVIVVSLPSAEGTDRVDLKLPDEYRRLIRGLVNDGSKKICLVLNVPGPVELTEFIDDIDAVFLIYYPGMEGARALYDIMSGKVNPSGRLTVTFPKRYEDTPAFLNYPDGFTCVYGEDIYVGYRGYEKRKVEPLFPFGFGLSYTDFEIENMHLDKSEYALGDTVKVSFTLKNTGTRDGAQVVQLYVGDPVSMQSKPVKELRAFGKYELKAGQSADYELEVSINDIGSYSEDYGKFLIEDGIYEVSLGFSSSDIRKKCSFRLREGSPELMLGIHSRVLDIMYIPSLRDALVEDIRRTGSDPQTLIDNERYTPNARINVIYKNAEEFNNFVKEYNNYLKE